MSIGPVHARTFFRFSLRAKVVTKRGLRSDVFVIARKYDSDENSE